MAKKKIIIIMKFINSAALIKSDVLYSIFTFCILNNLMINIIRMIMYVIVCVYMLKIKMMLNTK